MTFEEKVLYHQIHPAKLIVDFGTGFYTTWLAWGHQLGAFALLFFLPSIGITVVLVKFAGLERLKNSPPGKYIQKYMTKKVEAARFLGQITMWVAGWYHFPVVIAMGLIIILTAWANGYIRAKLSNR